MVFQSYALYPHMTVAGNIELSPSKFASVRRPRLRFSPPRLARAWKAWLICWTAIPAHLSGGQRQRVALARAIVAASRKAFLMDEPLSNLDARLRVEMRAELKHLQHELGIVTLAYVTHDQAEAMTLATRIAVIDEGKLLQFDTPWNVYYRPANLFVAGFLGSPAMNFLTDAERPGLIAGVRPEDVEVSLADQPGWRCARVYVVEAMGDGDFVRLQAGADQITARVAVDLPVDFDQTVWFRPRPEKVHFFDSKTQEAVRC